MRTPIRPTRTALADAACVLAARHALVPVLDRLADAPLDRSAVDALRSWLDDSYPSAVAALDRLEASGAAATPTPPRRPPRRLAAVPSGAGDTALSPRGWRSCT